MKWHARLRFLPVIALAACAGCSEDTGDPSALTAEDEPSVEAGTLASNSADPSSIGGGGAKGPRLDQEKKAILDSVIKLISTAATSPGGDNFTIATKHLNQYFAGADPQSFRLSDQTRDYLRKRLGEDAIKDLESSQFSTRDARHIEDCLLYHTIALRVAGEGDDLTRVRRVFDWMVRHIELIPAQSLAPPSGQQAKSRPYDVLLRGMATEEGAWAERSWLFMSLCRQLGIDCGLLAYTARPRGMLRAPAPDDAEPQESEVWACAALIDGTPYLFDARTGLEIPGPNGRGVATLEQAISDRRVFDQLDLPGFVRPDAVVGVSSAKSAPYAGLRADLVSAGKMIVFTEWSPEYLTTRMRNLQENLSGRNRMVLYRDSVEQEAAFRQALGARFGGVQVWSLPLEVVFGLFKDPRFVQATQFAIQLFDAKLPLLAARLAQLRGSSQEAVLKYLGFRLPDEPLYIDKEKKNPIPGDVQQALDRYATYFMALAKLDQGDRKTAESLFVQALNMLPEPGPGRPYLNMYRWGAERNLARIHEELGKDGLAVRYYEVQKPTAEYYADLLRARALVWRDPFVHQGVPALPPAPPAPPEAPAPPAQGPLPQPQLRGPR